ncbi:FadR/GntR family transcriptional regulator [Solicola gregarius]|uniref:GntR family transcriptional regulator n=1 Tax=Solicola gregarius TaxID=2908642 RepID=A0AA46TLG6_9ACTN|nr:GntR family transcriptional regulator [Solicola gregarius]UYM07265.1 GntR family transcriptional regulator [Solicola gregarius]
MASTEQDPLGTVTAVTTRSASAQVADQLVEAIRDGRLRTNDRLPSERELAQRFGVSRPTIRETFAALELAGLIQTHRGRPTTVIGTPAEVTTWGVEILPPTVFETRLVLEPALASLAAQKQYPEDLENLRDVLARLESEFEETGEYVSDLPVHLAVARAAHSPILERALADALRHTETDLWKSFRRRALVERSAREGHVDESRSVVRHIERGEPEAAADVWRHHLTRYRDEMLEGRGQQRS